MILDVILQPQDKYHGIHFVKSRRQDHLCFFPPRDKQNIDGQLQPATKSYQRKTSSVGEGRCTQSQYTAPQYPSQPEITETEDYQLGTNRTCLSPGTHFPKIEENDALFGPRRVPDRH